MKQKADKNRTKREFNEGDMVFLKLQPYRQASVEFRHTHKLSPNFFGPYKVLARVGKVVYRL